ncbi:MAG: metallophosphoesterase [Desulfovibrionaceae bacterium]|nr:metallophosphoesterase [Desulfovibrionaceae bacterium]
MPSPCQAAEGVCPATGASGCSPVTDACSAASAEGAPHTRQQCWVVLGDVHGEVGRIADIPELAGADGVILTGDLTKLGAVSAARAVIEAIQAVNPVVLAQIGNMDRPEVNEWLEGEGINLHRKVRELAPHTALLGVGGSTFTPFGTPSEFPEARFAEWLEALAARAREYRGLVLACHTPPWDTVCDRTGNGQHAGSRAVREFIEEHQPQVCLCGHIHEARGEQRIGRTHVLNSGAFAAGGYALLHLGDEVRAELRRLDA